MKVSFVFFSFITFYFILFYKPVFPEKKNEDYFINFSTQVYINQENDEVILKKTKEKLFNAIYLNLETCIERNYSFKQCRFYLKESNDFSKNKFFFHSKLFKESMNMPYLSFKENQKVCHLNVCSKAIQVPLDDLEQVFTFLKGFRKNIQERPIVLVSLVSQSSKNFHENKKLKAFFKKLYEYQGFIIKEFNLENLGSLTSFEKEIKNFQIQENIWNIYPEIEALVYIHLDFEKKKDSQKTLTLEGKLKIYELYLKKIQYISNETIDVKINPLSNFNLAYSKLIDKAIDSLNLNE